MHICMITREFPPEGGGIGYYVANLSKKLAERGHKTTIITRGSTKKTIKETIDGIDVYKVSFFPLYPIHMQIHGVFVKSLFNSLESQFDLVHIHSPVAPPIKTKLPIITTVHTPMKIDSKYHEIVNLYSLGQKIQSTYFTPPVEYKLFSISDSITAVAHSVANELKEYGLNPKEITVIGNGVNQEVFAPIQNREIKEEYILYTGRLHARKGLIDLLDCAERVCRENKQVRFIVCGGGPFYDKLNEEVQRRGMREKFLLQGFIKKERLIQLYKNATIHVVPSHYEGLPTVVLEGMSCGLPVVATDVGGNSEVISNNVNGFLIPSKNPDAMAEIIIKLLNDPALRERIGKSARKTIEENYSWDKITDKILQCYEKVIKTHNHKN